MATNTAPDNSVPGDTDPAANGGAVATAEPPSIPMHAFSSIGVPQGLKNSAGTIWRILIVLVGIFVAVRLVGYLGGVAIALFFSMVVAALGGPLQRALAKRMPNVLATVLTLLFMLILVLAVMGFVVEAVVSQAPSMVAAAQQGITQIEEWLRTGPYKPADTEINSLIDNAQKWLTTEGETIAKQVPSVLGSAADFITAASVAVFGSFFFLNSGKEIWGWAMSWVPGNVRTEVDDCGQAGWQTLSGYTRGIILIAIADGLLVGIGLVILKVPLAPALAVVVMFGALIPVIGAPIATLFAAVVALATEGAFTALLVVALTVIVGSFDGDILQPLIMGFAVNLHPLAIVSMIAFGTLTFGIIGALLAVPIGGSVYAVAKYLTGRSLPPRLQPPRPKRKLGLPNFMKRHKTA